MVEGILFARFPSIKSISFTITRHHARKSQASGFCYVADCILAILALKRLPVQLADMPIPAAIPKPRIMYLDLDLHFPTAVSEAFYSINISSYSTGTSR